MLWQDDMQWYNSDQRFATQFFLGVPIKRLSRLAVAVIGPAGVFAAQVDTAVCPAGESPCLVDKGLYGQRLS
jgi:hypothetical protein